MKHIPDNELEKHSLGILNFLVNLRVVQHLKNCEKCSLKLEQIKNDNLLLEELKTSIKNLPELDDADDEIILNKIQKTNFNKNE